MSTRDKENGPTKHDEDREQAHLATIRDQSCRCEQKSLAQVGGPVVKCFIGGNLGEHSSERDPIASVIMA